MGDRVDNDADLAAVLKGASSLKAFLIAWALALGMSPNLPLVPCRVRFCSSANGSLSAFLARNAAFRQLKAFSFAPDICETQH